jgi:hypothetical protein
MRHCFFWSLAAASLALGCAPIVEVQTDPQSQSIPVTSLGVESYVEIAIDLPPQSQGALEDIDVQEVWADLQVHNPSNSTSMLFSFRVSLQGTATPQTPYVFTAVSRPSYFNAATVLLGPKTYAAGSTTTERITGTSLVPALGRPRIWLIVSNTVNNLGLGEVLPLEIRLQNMVVHAVVQKSLGGLSGGLGPTGL